MFILLLTSVIGLSTDMTKVVQELDNKFASLWNAHDYQGLVAQLFTEDALVVPPLPTDFVQQPDLAIWFQLMHKYWGGNMTMTPVSARMEQEYSRYVIHEIGRWNGIYNRYYQRWVKHDGLWKITFIAIAIGEPQPNVPNQFSRFLTTVPWKSVINMNVGGDDPTQLMNTLEKKFDDLYNVQDFEGVAALFDKEGLLIPRSSDRFFKQSQLALYFQMAYSVAGLKYADTQAVTVVRESPTVIHELGGIHVNYEDQFLPYYLRWVLTNSGWKIKFYLSVFPIPHPHPPEIKPE
jgi:hypothetical protein